MVSVRWAGTEAAAWRALSAQERTRIRVATSETKTLSSCGVDESHAPVAVAYVKRQLQLLRVAQGIAMTVLVIAVLALVADFSTERLLAASGPGAWIGGSGAADLWATLNIRSCRRFLGLYQGAL